MQEITLHLGFAVYTFIYENFILKLDDKIFEDAEEITSKLNLPRNRYINEAVKIYNLYHTRRLLKLQLLKESKASSVDSIDILLEFEKLNDEN
ncbi:MAG: hypothetical protein EOO43_08760 [Flavobacterium sp.]|nr:MAG: hypothetical protein EOO43_08760 [Flavobacterium sp.]